MAAAAEGGAAAEVAPEEHWGRFLATMPGVRDSE